MVAHMVGSVLLHRDKQAAQPPLLHVSRREHDLFGRWRTDNTAAHLAKKTI